MTGAGSLTLTIYLTGRLYVSQSTVKTHVARAIIKRAACDRAQLVVAAYESGLARPGWAGAP